MKINFNLYNRLHEIRVLMNEDITKAKQLLTNLLKEMEDLLCQ